MSGGTAWAVPPGLDRPEKAEAWTCDGEDVMIFTAGRNGWIGDTHYLAVSFTIDGTFTPTGGEPEPFSESKTWGGGKSGPGEITCTQHVEDEGLDGSAVFDAQVTAFPVL